MNGRALQGREPLVRRFQACGGEAERANRVIRPSGTRSLGEFAWQQPADSSLTPPPCQVRREQRPQCHDHCPQRPERDLERRLRHRRVRERGEPGAFVRRNCAVAVLTREPTSSRRTR